MLETLEDRRLLVAGALDTSFGTGGIQRVDLMTNAEQAARVVVQPDGKLVTAGSGLTSTGNWDFVIARFLVDGALDPSFGISGKAVVQVGTGDDFSESLVIQPDGKILVVGSAVAGSNTDVAMIRLNTNGSLDTTFGTQGKVITAFGAGNETGREIALSTTGDIFVAGDTQQTNQDMMLLKYSSNGVLDNSFDGDGRLAIDFGPGDVASSLAVQNDGKIAVSGYRYNGTDFDFAMARVSSTGVLDNTFGTSGKMSFPVGTGADYAASMLLLPDGLFALAGYTTTGVKDNIAVARVTATGQLDTSFGTSGKTVVSIGAGNDRAQTIALQPDGKLLIAGLTTSGASVNMAAVRLTASGAIDNLFDGDGRLTIDVVPQNDLVYSVAIQGLDTAILLGTSTNGPKLSTTLARVFVTDSVLPNNLDLSFGVGGKVTSKLGSVISTGNSVAAYPGDRYVVAGSASSGNLDIAVARYTSDGQLDPTFSGDGKVTTPIGTSDDIGKAVAVYGDKIVVGGNYKKSNGVTEFFVAQYLADGTLDTSFSGDGISTLSFGTVDDVAQGIALQPDGKIVIVGSSNNGVNNDIAIARLLPDGSLDGSFGSGGKFTLAIGSSHDAATSVIIQNDKIVVAGTSFMGATGWDFVVLRLLMSNGTLDSSFSGDGIASRSLVGDEFSSALASDASNRIVVAGKRFGVNDDFSLTRFNTDGSLDTSWSTDFGFGNDGATAVAIQADGKIVASGIQNIAIGNALAVARYITNGALDPTFDTDGKATLSFGTSNDAARGMFLGAEGKITVAGNAVIHGLEQFAIARFNGTTPPSNLALSSSLIAENQPVGTTVGTFTTTDVDAGDSFTYSLVGGPGSTDNANFVVVGNSLKTTLLFSYNTQSSYSIRVRSTDALGASFDKVFLIQVLTGLQVPVLDINATPSVGGSGPKSLTQVGNTLYFLAATATTGEELWKSDGTSAGTVLVKDIRVGINGGNLKSLTNVNGTLYFSANDGINGYELWKSDGTSAGTVMIKDIYVGANSATRDSLVNVNGTLYFSATDGINGYELWKSDGTAAGTVLIKDIHIGASHAFPHSMTAVNGMVYFSANDGTSGFELWKSDGTAAGTTLVKDILIGINSANPNDLLNLNGTVFFSANDGSNGYELWKSDGTPAGTVLVKDIRVGTNNAFPQMMTNVNGIVYFNANDGTNGNELWKSDGTAAGTVLVKDIGVGSSGAFPQNLTNVNGMVYFTANDGTIGHELWKSDGTATGTVLVKDVRVGLNLDSPRNLTNVNGTLYFSVYDGVNSYELWKSVGTSAGTVLVKTLGSGSTSAYPGFLANVNGIVYFSVFDDINGYELWRSDSSSKGAELIRDIHLGTSNADPQILTNVNGTIYFRASNSIHGSELWKSDGTTTGTVLVKDIWAGSSNATPSQLTNVNGTLFFRANDGINGLELWKSDGTAAGTVLVKDIRVGTSGAALQSLTNVNGTIYFRASDGINGDELWKSDGTAAGTLMVKDIRTGINSAAPQSLTNVNGVLYFLANDGTNGYELWKSDGTPAGTLLVKDIHPGATGFYPQPLANVNGTVYFLANDGTNGYELWKSDGTPTGTLLVKDIRVGSNGSAPQSLTNVNGTLFFKAADGTSGYELWKSDGTPTGTVLVKDIFAGTTSADPQLLTNVNGMVYFRANDSINGVELWKSDGTTAGTTLVKDIGPGSIAGSILNLTNFNGVLYFQANDGVLGEELWMSDGSSAGTVLSMDLNPVGGSAPGNLTPFGSTLIFTATTDAFGVELHQTNAGPVAISLSNSTLDENSPLGSVVGQLSTTDSSLNDRHTYTFVSGAGDIDNALFGIEGGYVTVTTLLDYETKPTYSLRIRSTDRVGEFVENTFNITVTDRLLEPLRDLNQTPGPNNSSAPTNHTKVGDLVYFTAEGSGTGIELWRTDGTAAGTFMVRDINAGELSSYPARLTNVSGVLYFQANNGITGDELWKSDGTSAGTVLVKDIRTGAPSPGLNALVNVNGTLYFQANDGTNGSELWKSNGTTTSTVMVANLRAGNLSSRPTQLTNLNGTLLFNATDGTGGYELWKSDGTSAGTVLVRDIVTGATSSNPVNLTNAGGSLVFVASTATEGTELWKSDGTTAGTVLLKDIRTGTSSSSPANFLAIGSTVYFTANDGSTGVELWKSDGTSAGTALVKDARAGTASSSPTNLTDVGGTVYFTANDGGTGIELWKSDGTTAGTVSVKDIAPGAISSTPISLTNLNGTLFFQASDGITGQELWKSNGTAAGTLVVADIRTGGVGSFPGNLTALGTSLVFAADDNVSGRELWLSDGTQASSLILKDIKRGTADASISSPVNFNGTLIFAGSDGLSGIELWKTDGTSGNTVLVKDIAVGSGSSSPRNFTIVGSMLYFTADNGVDGEELWKTDGTAAGTVMVRNIPNGPLGNGSMPHELMNANGQLYFVVSNSQSGGDELWKSDGTLAGTDNFFSMAQPGETKYLTNVNGILYMRANGGNGTHLWRTDGTSAGTTIVSPINPNPGFGSSPSQLTNVNGTLFFVANDGTNGYEVWKTNGTSISTVLVKDIEPGPTGAFFPWGFGVNLTNVGGALYFSATTSALGTELWKSDGTNAGTVMVADISSGLPNSLPSNLTNVNGVVYFVAQDGTNGFELWKTDGTMSGTSMVKDINPGSSGSSPNSLVNLNGVLYMVASDNVHGFELWKSDGTAAGTVLVDDIGRGFAISGLTSLVGSAGALYFVASTQTYGAELYKLSTNSAPQSIALDSTAVAENLSAGAAVGSLSAIDPDAGDTLTFSLPSGVGDNNSFTILGTALKTAGVFNFETKPTYAITVRVTDAAGLFIDRPFTISVINLAELQQPVKIGDGFAQRSRVNGLTIDFDSDMIVDADAFLVRQRTIVNGSPVFANVTTQFALTTLPSGATRATLEFSGALTRGSGALVDGYYQLTILGAKVRIRSSGLAFDGDANGVAGGDYVLGAQEADNFFALYGDTNGDGIVGVAEFGQFRTAFGKSSSDAGYNQLYDYELDNAVGVSDFGQFRSRFGKPKLQY